MDERLEAAGKDVLVELVKLAQKRGMEGSKGGWKDFLSLFDKKFGASLSDPSKRSTDVLLAFLKTFSQENDLKYFEKVMECHVNCDAVENFQKKSTDIESPEQKLVRLTLEHHQYPSNYSFPSHEEVKLDKLVNPNKAVADYRTEITGISSEDLDGETCSLIYVQKSLKNLLRDGTILVGHSLNNDLQALKLDHARVIDTSLVFKYADGSNFRRPSLNDLCKAVLGFELRKKGAPHNCLDDASAAMKLVLAYIEGGVDDVVPFFKKMCLKRNDKVTRPRIPISLPKEELHKIIPGDFIIEMKSNKKAGGGKYSALAIFGNQQQANEAFQDLDGKQEQDSSGRPQKLISFKLNSGVTGSLCVCKMTRDDQLGQTTSKKRSQEDETPVESKKLKLDQTIRGLDQTQAGSKLCDDHLKEIERLKLQLSLRDQEISNLNKIIVGLTRKQRGVS